MNKILYIIIACIILFSCKKDIIESPDCENLRTGLLELNDNIVKNEIEKLTADLHPHPQPEDPIGHIYNLQTFADRINSNCSIFTATVECYVCIETYPPLSEILVEFEENGETRNIIIDLVTSGKDILRFGGVHQM
jgi:hypothetical protein